MNCAPDLPDWFATCRADGRDPLGSTPAARYARLARLRAAISAAGLTALEGNQDARQRFGVVGIELLTSDEAERLIAVLARPADLAA